MQTTLSSSLPHPPNLSTPQFQHMYLVVGRIESSGQLVGRILAGKELGTHIFVQPARLAQSQEGASKGLGQPPKQARVSVAHQTPSQPAQPLLGRLGGGSPPHACEERVAQLRRQNTSTGQPAFRSLRSGRAMEARQNRGTSDRQIQFCLNYCVSMCEVVQGGTYHPWQQRAGPGRRCS